MPTYEYKCDNCDHSFEIVQSMKDKHKRKCPNCKKSKLKRVMGTPLVFVKGDPQSIGHWAERNTQKMGSYERSEKRELENKNKDKKSQPWWRKDSKYSNNQIKNMSESQRKNFIEKGE